MESESTRFALLGGRAKTAAAVLAVGAFGAGFAACGDDNEEEAEKPADESVESVLREQATKALEEAEDQPGQLPPEVQKQIDEAQRRLDEAQK